MTTSQLIQQVRNIVAYDLDVPQDSPGTTVTDAEILTMLNHAQDELARELQLYSPSISFTFASGSSFAYDNVGFSHRINIPHKVILSTGEEVRQILPSQHNPAVDVIGGKYWFWTDNTLNYFPVQSSSFSGFVQGLYLPPVMASGDSCGLPHEIASRHLARYTVGVNASAFATEQHQMIRLNGMVTSALDACTDYRSKTKVKRVNMNRPNQRYYV